MTQHYSATESIAERTKFIDQLFDQVRDQLADSGLAVLTYHRIRMEVEIRLFWEDHKAHYSLRDMQSDDFASFCQEVTPTNNVIADSIYKNLGYQPTLSRTYNLTPANGISACLYIFTRADLAKIDQAVSGRLPQWQLHFENAILRDSLQRKELELQLLQGTGEIISASVKLDELFESIEAALRRLISFNALSIFIRDETGENLREIFSVGYGEEEYRHLLEKKAGDGLVGWSLKTGEPVIVPDVSKDSRYFEALSVTKSELVAPLTSDGQVIGAFNLESETLDAYSPADLEMVSAFANQAAISITRAKLFEQALDKHKIEEELQIARNIQESFLPHQFPQHKGFDFDAINISSFEVGGDYFDFIPIVDSQLGIAIADVSGKGVPAALIMASFRASLIAEIRNNYAIRTIMHKVNSLICESVERGNFVTAVYGVLDIKNRMFTFSNAGHNPPLMLRVDNTIERLTDGGLMLGIIADQQYDERPIHIGHGDILIFYTDGVTEAENEIGEQFGTERLVEMAKKYRNLPAKQIRGKIVEAINKFRSSNIRLDDLTLLLIKAE